MAGESLGHEVLVEAEAGMPQLDFSTWPNLIFWLVVSLAGLYFILTRVAHWRIMAAMVLGGLVFGGLFHYALGVGPSPLFHVLSGGFLFGAVFMATDPVSAAATPVAPPSRWNLARPNRHCNHRC